MIATVQAHMIGWLVIIRYIRLYKKPGTILKIKATSRHRLGM